MSSSVNNVNGGGAKADNEHTVPWGPEHVEDADKAPAPETSPTKDPLDRELDQYQTEDQIMREKQRQQKAEIYRGTRSKYSPAVKKWRQRQ